MGDDALRKTTRIISAYPESIVVDCYDLCARLCAHCNFMHDHGIFDHHNSASSSGRRKTTCTHTFNELMCGCMHKDLYIWDHLTTEHIAAWCAFFRAISAQNPRCLELRVSFVAGESDHFAFHYKRDSDCVSLLVG